MSEVAVLGAGSWGTALACQMARGGAEVALLFRRPEAAEAAARERSNAPYLPGVSFPATVRPTSDPVEALAGARLVLITTPVRGLDLAVSWLSLGGDAEACIVSCAKGIRPGTLQTPLAFLGAALPGRAARLAVLSGPTFAPELARGDPTAAVVASHDRAVAREVQERVAGGPLRLYVNEDPIGVELAGALKNVVALAAGMIDGLGFGMNTAAALMTRGLSEITRLGMALGGRPGTFAGLAGMGDLVLTCTGRWSRNRSVGIELGRGRPLAEVIDGMRMVAEGVFTAGAARDLARRERIEMPITEQVSAVLFEGRRPSDAVASLLARDLRDEDR